LILPAFLLACLGFAAADDLTTVGGGTFKNAQVIRYDADGVVVKHDGGTNHIVWKELPATARQRYQAEARKQKDDEIQKLKQDLARAEAEAARLRPDDGRPDTSKESKKPADSTTLHTAVSTTPSVAELPPLKPDDILDANELVEQFKSDPPGADRRYRKKTFRVKGVVERFESRLFVRKYDVILESPDRFFRVVAAFDYPNDYRAVFSTRGGKTLVGKPAENKEVTLMQAGQAVMLQGTCKGARDAQIVFTGCALIR
jgi:hypothetical protein